MPSVPEVVTLRQYFAGQAMIALMSNAAWVESLNSHAVTEDLEFKTALALQAWTMADVMLAHEREGGAA